MLKTLRFVSLPLKFEITSSGGVMSTMTARPIPLGAFSNDELVVFADSIIGFIVVVCVFVCILFCVPAGTEIEEATARRIHLLSLVSGYGKPCRRRNLFESFADFVELLCRKVLPPAVFNDGANAEFCKKFAENGTGNAEFTCRAVKRKECFG